MEVFKFVHFVSLVLLFLPILISFSDSKSIRSTSLAQDHTRENSTTHGYAPLCKYFDTNGSCINYHECRCLGGVSACTDTGVCLGSCLLGWRGSHCNISCPLGTWGANCSSNCSVNCSNRTCDPRTGGCFCETGAPHDGCWPSPRDIESFVTKFWLTICVLSCFAVILILCAGVTLPKPFLPRKKNVWNLFVKRPNPQNDDKRSSIASSVGMDVNRTNKGKPGAQLNSSHDRKRFGSSSTVLSHGQPRRRDSTHSSIMQTAIRKSNTNELARELAQAMPDFDVHFDNAGQLTIKRKRRGKALDKDTIRKIIMQRAQKAQEKMRKRSLSHDSTNTSVTEAPSTVWKRTINKSVDQVSSVKNWSSRPQSKVSTNL
ncbi:angiopoietin-1 receptor [Elysia marginata]|uniref:Angiopoietin-1 receptor n=1 Tax=Elysia marginata TaxID=1093978 RepID=A0AAV4G952_9GAST|nr:angiopoietin-1 receptor [Elysia marginata]